jgi:hypothetical protein
MNETERDLQELRLSAYVSDPSHGGKVTCHKCNGFIQEKDLFTFGPPAELDFGSTSWYFHKDCFNPYEHYYGLDRPID